MPPGRTSGRWTIRVLTKRLALTLASLAVAVPLMVAQVPVRAEPSGDAGTVSALGFGAGAVEPLRVLDRAREPLVANQVRIERRVIIRISPSPQTTREQMMARLPKRPMRTSFAEVEHEECVPIQQIAGVQPTQDNRLMLFMRDRKVLTAELARGCSAQAFYSGFYVENSSDGKLCVSRDRLQSRTGDMCAVEGFNRLVAVRD